MILARPRPSIHEFVSGHAEQAKIRRENALASVGILFRYILREMAFSTLLGALLFTFVLFVRSVGPVMELLVRASVPAREVLRLFVLTIPESLPYTIPMGVLAGTLIALGRLSTDGEITAMRAAGVPGRACLKPVAAFSLLGALVCAASTLEVTPWAARELQQAGDALRISEATAQVRPRVFIEDFPSKVVWVQDVLPGDVIHWKGLFLADTRSPESRGSISGINAAVDGPRITVAEEAVVIPLADQERLQLHFPHATTYEQSYDPTQYQSFDYEAGDQVIEAAPSVFETRNRPLEQMTTAELRRVASRRGENSVAAGISLHRRLALPIACLVLPLIGIPLAISTQRSGKSTGVVLSVAVAFVYWMLLTAGIALAEQGRLPPEIALWAANAIFAVVGATMLAQLDSTRRRDVLAWVGSHVGWVIGWIKSLFSRKQRDARGDQTGAVAGSEPGGAMFEAAFSIIDRYMLRSFFFYFAVMMAAFISIWFVFSFFELLGDMLEQGKMGRFIPYIYYLTPFLIYETSPIAVMVATLVSFGLLSKHSELTAFRACGVSLFRLAAPIMLSAGIIGGLMFGLDHFYLPRTNRQQDAIRDEIKGRPVRTFFRADRQWTFGAANRIFYHRYFDYDSGELGSLNIYDLAEEPFRMVRHIAAESALWDEAQSAWIVKNGWVREIESGKVSAFDQFESRPFPDIEESPDYFQKEERQHQQMNWRELDEYILDLAQAGFETVRFQVQWHRKFSFPFFPVAMALLAIPFALLTGRRSALAPVAASLGLAMAYYSFSALFEQLGRAHQLSPLVAAWAPGLIFTLGGSYMLLRAKT